MRNIKDSSAVYMTGELSQPCSNSGLIHHECGGWFLASVLTPCTYSWKSTCQVDAMHEQNSKATVFAVDVESELVFAWLVACWTPDSLPRMFVQIIS